MLTLDIKTKVGKTILIKAKYYINKNAITGIMIRPNNSMGIIVAITMENNVKLKVLGKKLFITKKYLTKTFI